MNRRMDRTRLNIGTYFLDEYARTEQHLRDLVDCGIDFVVCMDDDRAALDLFDRYHVGAVLTGILPGWWGGDGNDAGRLAEKNPIEKYEQAAAAFKDHPAVWGIDCGDEPSALDFPYYGRVMRTVDRIFPNQFGYLNLYPNYASVAVNTDAQTVNQLGTPTYAEHIAEYVKNVGTDYICYDFYMYSTTVAAAYENLQIVSDACLRTGRSMWIVLQVNSNRPAEWITENQLRFQAYSAMAFGAENIIWACYTAGWWYNQVLDDKGEKTEQYDKLKQVNSEIAAIGREYMRFRRTATHFLGDASSADYARLIGKPIDSLSTGIFADVRAEHGESLIAGQMVSRSGDGSYALMLCAADDTLDRNNREFNVLFRADGRRVRAVSGSGELPLTRLEDGSYSLPIRSCGGVLLIAE